MINEPMKLFGSMTATLVRGNGDVEVTKKDNLIVNNGFDFICNSLADGASRPAAMSHIAIGTAADSPAPDQTELVGHLVRIPATYAHTSGTKVFTMTATFNPGVGDGRIQEAGVFNDATPAGSIMLDRVQFNEINKGPSDSLTVQFSFTLS